MIRDQGPNNSLGFGVTRGQIPENGEREAADPESGVFARALHDHPLARFFAVSLATVAAAHGAGSLVRGAGKKGLSHMARQAATSQDPRYNNLIKGFRDVRDTLDEYEGIARKRGQRSIDIKGNQKIIDDPSLDTTVTKSGFFFSAGEKERMKALGMDPPAEWTMRNEIQQRLVRQARRLPYELPAAYIVQRGVTDRLFGVNDEREKVNWSNPLDVMGDFAQQSVKNIATSLVPFEVAGGVAKQGWRRAMTMSSNHGSTGLHGGDLLRDLSLSIEGSLGLVGQEMSDILGKATRYSQQSAGAMSTAFKQASGRTRPVVETLNAMRQGNKVATTDIPLFGDMIRLNRVFRDKWHGIGDEFDHAEAFLAGRKTIRSGAPVDPEKAAARIGSTKFHQMASSVTSLGGVDDKAADGIFARDMRQNTFRTMVKRHAAGLGMPEEAADQFARSAKFRLPTSLKSTTPMERRVGFGQDDIFEGKGKWENEFAATMKNFPGGEKFQDLTFIERVIRGADRDYLRQVDSMDERIGKQWKHMMKNFIAPEARNSLGHKRAAYGEFSGAMTGEQGEFLIRRSASRLGIPTQKFGVPTSTGDLHSLIREHGLDPANKHQLRAFLIDKGDISKPWNPKGLNFFGLQSLSVQEALDRRVISDTDEVSGQAKNLASAIRGTDWDKNVLNRLNVGGIYKTANDNIIDFNPILRAGRTFADRLNTEFQVPFIHIKPLQLLGYKVRSDIDNSPFIQFQGGYRSQPFVGSPGIDDAEGHLWFKGRRARGRVARIGTDNMGRANGEWLDGTYRPMDTGANTLAGRNIRLAAQTEQGRVPNNPRNRFKQIFNIDENQPDSIPEAFRRFRNRRTDPNYITPASRAVLNDDPFADPARMAQMGETVSRTLRSSGIPRNVAENAPRGGAMASILTAPDGTDVFNADNRRTLSALRRAFNEDPATVLNTTDPSHIGDLRRAQKNTLGRWNQVYEPRLLDDPLPQKMASVGLNRQIDALRMDLARYMGIRTGLQQGTLSEFNDFMGRALGELEGMRKSGSISSQDLAEARAALGSMQIGFIGMKKYSTDLTDQEVNLSVIQEIQSNPTLGNLRDIIRDAGEHRTMGGKPVRRELAMRIKQRIGFGDQQFDGTEFNPFSANQDSVYVPTFSTAFARNPGKALQSVFGFGTWNDPDSFSGLGIASSHIMNRMNRPLAGFGIGLDPSKYNGPAHMLAQGFFAQRALPIVAAGSTFMAVDRTVGGMVTPRDEEGDRVYRPVVMGAVGRGVVEAQAAASGLMPGGATAAEKREELLHGEVAVRKGRWWPLGNTPWQGGKVQYYRPSWYRRMQSGYQYSEQGWDSPMEKLLYGQDFSPLRPLDPYRFEREHYYDRPYPVTGEYFTGPWGPMTAVLNQTVGRVLKPRKEMHEEEVQYNLSRYQPVGAHGMAAPSTLRATPGEPTVGAAIGMAGGGGGGGGGQNAAYMAASGAGAAYASGSTAARGSVFASNEPYLSAVGRPAPVRGVSTAPPSYPFTQDSFKYNPYDLANPRRPANAMLAAEPVNPGSFGYQASEFGYLMQEWSGIYGFGVGSIRAGLGFGDQDMNTRRPVLASPGAAYGSSRAFWDLNLGGLGDFPTPLEGDYANLEISEVTRRFIPKPRKPNEINPIENNMGKMFPWLPGNEYFKNFKWGDPYTTVPEGEMRLPGAGYEATHRLHPDETGRYGRLDRFRILADVAPYSDQFRQAQAEMRASGMTAYEQNIFDLTLERVENVKRNNDFTPYKFKYSSAEEQGMSELEFRLHKVGERMAHANTYANTKFMPDRTAVEDWERDHVYGASFAQWQHPISDFLMPAVYRATTRNPIMAGVGLGFIGSMFGATPQARAVGGLVGSIIGVGAGLVRGGSETVSGERFIPPARRQEMALEEYADILQYTKSSRAYHMAKAANNEGLATQFKKQMQSTMYGADLYEGTPGELAQSIPKRKREHFRAMLAAPEEERGRILSTAGRLERRIYQAAWGMKVERRPDLPEYFAEHELPEENWEGWDPRMSMDLIKIKMGQQQGLNMSQMGYYPQQLREANMINPSYPDQNQETSVRSARARLERLLTARGMSGSVREVQTPYAGKRAEVSYGAY